MSRHVVVMLLVLSPASLWAADAAKTSYGSETTPEEGPREKALKTLRAAILKAPEDVGAHRAYQTAMINLGRYLQVKKEYEQRLSRRGSSALDHYLLANLEDDMSRARRLVAEGIQRDKGNRWLRWQECLLKTYGLYMHGQEEEAMKTLDSFPPQQRDPSEYHLYRSVVLNQLGRLDEAMVDVKQAIAAWPNSPIAYELRATIEILQNKPAAALDSYAKAERLGDFAAVHVGRSIVLWDQGKIPQAKAELKKALQSPRDNNNWACSQAYAHFILNEHEQAKQSALLVQRLSPEETCAVQVLASSRLVDRQMDEAERIANAALDQNPHDQNGLIAMAMVHLWRGRYKEAAAYFQKDLDRIPNSSNLLVEKAVALIYSGDCDAADVELKKARQLAPGSPEIDRAEGVCANARRSYQSAIKHFRAVLRVLPEDYESYEGLASAQTYLERYDEARLSYLKAARFAPNLQEKERITNYLKSQEYSRKSTFQPFPKDEKAKAVVYAKAKTLPIGRLLAYEERQQRFTGTPWSAASPVYRTTETFSSNVPPAWSSDGKILYVPRDGITALDVETGRTRPVLAFPKRRVPHLSAGELKLLSSEDEDEPEPPWWVRPIHRTLRAWAQWRLASYGGDRISGFSLSRDSQTLYFILWHEGLFGQTARLERIQVDGRGREVLQTAGAHRWLQFYFHTLSGRMIVSSDKLYLFEPASKKSHPILDESGFSPQFSFSPDGRRVAVAHGFGEDQELHILNLDTGRKSYLAVHGREPGWSPDGKKIAYIFKQKELRLYDLASGQVERVVGQLEQDTEEPEDLPRLQQGVVWSPDSRFAAYTLGALRDSETKEPIKSATCIADIIGRKEWCVAKDFTNMSWSPTAWHGS